MAFRSKNSVVGRIDEIQSEYTAARSSRFTRRRSGVPSAGASADYHYRNENQWLRLLEYARDMDRNDVAVGQIVDRAVLNTIQGGFQLDINTGDAKLDDDLLARWQAWTEDPRQCDVAGEMTFPEMEEMSLRAVFVDGDIIPAGTDEGQLQHFEAHRCRTPKAMKGTVVHGVELNGLRNRIRYYISKDDLDPSKTVQAKHEFTGYNTLDGNGVRRIFHAHLAKRFTQTRGVTAFAPIFDTASIHDDIEFAAALKQQVSACLVTIRERDEHFLQIGDDGQYGERTEETRADGSQSLTEGVAPMLEVKGRKGEKIHGFAHNTPGTGFVEHVKLLLTFVGINLGLPLVMVLMDAGETNFSGWRGAIDQARMGFRRNQRRFAARYHTPIVIWKVWQWASEDAALMRALRPFIRDGRMQLPHDWRFPQWPYVEPLKDRLADIADVGNCLSSAREVDARNGRKFFNKVDLVIEERAYAIDKAIQVAAKLNAKHKDNQVPVRWDQLFCFPSPDGIRNNFSGMIGETSAAAAPAKEAA
jgi:capsid protein